MERMQAEIEQLRALLGKLHWKSIDKDNIGMSIAEFHGNHHG